jgi:DnaJ like chaperone protein
MYYATFLKLHHPFTFEDVRYGYRELVKQYHPDKVQHLGSKIKIVAESEMKEINEAYDYFKKKYGE